MRLFSNSSLRILRYSDPVDIFFDSKNNTFWGDLSDISAQTATLFICYKQHFPALSAWPTSLVDFRCKWLFSRNIGCRPRHHLSRSKSQVIVCLLTCCNACCYQSIVLALLRQCCHLRLQLRSISRASQQCNAFNKFSMQQLNGPNPK